MYCVGPTYTTENASWFRHALTGNYVGPINARAIFGPLCIIILDGTAN